MNSREKNFRLFIRMTFKDFKLDLSLKLIIPLTYMLICESFHPMDIFQSIPLTIMYDEILRAETNLNQLLGILQYSFQKIHGHREPDRHTVP